jgi:hypothetical protein
MSEEEQIALAMRMSMMEGESAPAVQVLKLDFHAISIGGAFVNICHTARAPP